MLFIRLSLMSISKNSMGDTWSSFFVRFPVPPRSRGLDCLKIRLMYILLCINIDKVHILPDHLILIRPMISLISILQYQKGTTCQVHQKASCFALTNLWWFFWSAWRHFICLLCKHKVQCQESCFGQLQKEGMIKFWTHGWYCFWCEEWNVDNYRNVDHPNDRL